MVWAVLFAVGCKAEILQPTASAAPSMDETLRAINEDYVASVKPLFARSCARCHGGGNVLPWYHALPGVRGIIDDDIARARRMVDMSHDFPFRGRSEPSDQLESIDAVLEDGSMPPLRFRAMHWASSFSAADKAIVHQWVERSLRRVQAPGATAH